MTGIIDGSAPPFIVMSFLWLMGAALVAYANYAAERPSLFRKTGGFLLFYFSIIFVLGALILLRIAARAALPDAEGERLFWGIDTLALSLLALANSSWPVLAWITWKYAQEAQITPSNA